MKRLAVSLSILGALFFFTSIVFAQEVIPNLQGTWILSGKEMKTGLDGKKHSELLAGEIYIYQNPGPYDPLVPNITMILPTAFRDIAYDGFVRGKLIFLYWIEQQIGIPGEEEDEWEGRTVIGTIGKKGDTITWSSMSFDSGSDMDTGAGKGKLNKISDAVPPR
jgi:hypothetical protein